MSKKLGKVTILGVDFSAASEKEILEYIINSLKNHHNKYFIVTPNPELVMIARRNDSYRTVLNQAHISTPDGIGILYASKILGKGIKRRISGVDLMEKICQKVAKEPITTGFLGGRRGVAEKTAECLREKYPGLHVVYSEDEWDEAKLHEKGIDILFVAFGSPKQEQWIAENIEKLPVNIAIGVGGAFDFVSGKVPRAPKFVRDAGFEWLYRLIRQPWRIKRQLVLPHFAMLVLWEKARN